jgi:hypothetical protein
LDTQESQWSASKFNQNSFQPVNEQGKEIVEIDDEQEIVTIDPELDRV